MIVNDINLLQPSTKAKALKLFEMAKREGITLELNETLRTVETQMIYYLQGRIKEKDVPSLNKLRKHFSFWELGKKEALTEVTWTLDSAHFTGRAFDVVIVKDGKRTYDVAMLKKVGAMAPQCGLSWGGSFGDLPHFQDDSK
jgi:D-alanyl-D-alanine dipeptidase